MPIYQTAHYQVKQEAVESVKAAIVELVDYVRQNEPGSKVYTAWQQQDDPTKFVHLFEFADEDAHQAHGSSAAVRRFEAAISFPAFRRRWCCPRRRCDRHSRARFRRSSGR